MKQNMKLLMSSLFPAYARPMMIRRDGHMASPFRNTTVIGVKSGMHFRAFYENFTDKLLIVDVPGTTRRDITLFEHTQLKGPIYPLDENTTFRIAD